MTLDNTSHKMSMTSYECTNIKYIKSFLQFQGDSNVLLLFCEMVICCLMKYEDHCLKMVPTIGQSHETDTHL